MPSSSWAANAFCIICLCAEACAGFIIVIQEPILIAVPISSPYHFHSDSIPAVTVGACHINLLAQPICWQLRSCGVTTLYICMDIPPPSVCVSNINPLLATHTYTLTLIYVPRPSVAQTMSLGFCKLTCYMQMRFLTCQPAFVLSLLWRGVKCG